MGIIDNFLIKSVKNNNIKNVKFALSLYDTLNSFRKFFSKTMSFKNTGSFDINNNQALNQALGRATDHKIMELLINRGADIHSIDENGKNVIIRVIENLAESKNLKLDSEKNLPAEIILHPIVSFLLGKGAEYYSTDDLNVEAIQQKPPRCTVPECDGMIKYEKKIPSKEELWDKYYMGAPKQHRRFVEQYKIEKRA
ncbi:ankyrin repeat domain-containing protein [Wolbachia endosymbiont (group A) of Volucella inflata]|uniref:ankyrin repeat domain-containing protein n=1 Tax=Wolbachia endosymbiont (group A) of Volucella inflata TaxID=2954065 RepID=UPI002227B7CE|nr:ankyrin repeat domain-containing protein [Wolbachia endosymbiont (group A) of Volucella inflata]